MKKNVKKVILSDGRKLTYDEFGDNKGYPMIHAHGGPGSRIEGKFFDEKAKEFGIRFIIADRPGYGGSDSKDKKGFNDYANDIRELADNLKIENFAVSGYGGGVPFSLAAANKLGDRVEFVLSVAGFSNPDESLDEDQIELEGEKFSAHLKKTVPLVFDSFINFLRSSDELDPKELVEILIKRTRTADVKIFSDKKLKKIFVDNIKEAIHPELKDRSFDEIIEFADWDFRLEDIQQKVHLIHGEEDKEVPFENSVDLGKRIPNSMLHRIKGAGHFFPFIAQGLIFQIAKKEIDQLQEN